MIKVGIVGGTGYTGVELLRLLAQHPQAEVAVITSRSEAGVAVADMYPNLRGHYDGLAFSVPDSKALAACDVPVAEAHAVVNPANPRDRVGTAQFATAAAVPLAVAAAEGRGSAGALRGGGF